MPLVDVKREIESSFAWVHQRGKPKRHARERIVKGIASLSDQEKIMLAVILEEFHSYLLRYGIDTSEHGGSAYCKCIVAEMLWKIERPGEPRHEPCP